MSHKDRLLSLQEPFDDGDRKIPGDGVFPGDIAPGVDWMNDESERGHVGLNLGRLWRMEAFEARFGGTNWRVERLTPRINEK